MIQIVKQTRQERYDMYMANPKDNLVSMLSARDKYEKIISSTPKEMVKTKEEYEEMNKEDLCWLLADRALYEFPDSCKELEEEL